MSEEDSPEDVPIEITPTHSEVFLVLTEKETSEGMSIVTTDYTVKIISADEHIGTLIEMAKDLFEEVKNGNK